MATGRFGGIATILRDCFNHLWVFKDSKNRWHTRRFGIALIHKRGNAIIIACANRSRVISP